MSFWDCIISALKGLRANKLRSGLTVLGMVVGIGAVIALVSMGQGAQSFIVGQIGGMGTDLLIVRPGSTMVESELNTMSAGASSSLTLDDADAIANPRNCPSVDSVAPEVMTAATVTYSDRSMTSMVSGGTPEHEYVYKAKIDYGQSMTWAHVRARSRVCVLGHHAAEYLFEGINPLDKMVRINGLPFKTIGVFKSGTGMMMMSNIMEDSVMVPITTAQAKIISQQTAGGSQGIQNLYVKAVDETKVEEAKTEVTNLLRQRHDLKPGDDNDFTIMSQQQMLDVLNSVTGMMTLLLGGIAAISLIVAGIGIMNIMFVSVRERTREIGIRRAVGARRKDILSQFLTEAVTLSLVGGILGILIGYGITLVASYIAGIYGFAFPAMISPTVVALAFGIAAAVGLIFGIFPAARAAQLNPIEALRYE